MISIRVHPGNALSTLEGKSRIRPHGLRRWTAVLINVSQNGMTGSDSRSWMLRLDFQFAIEYRGELSEGAWQPGFAHPDSHSQSIQRYGHHRSYTDRPCNPWGKRHRPCNCQCGGATCKRDGHLWSAKTPSSSFRGDVTLFIW